MPAPSPESLSAEHARLCVPCNPKRPRNHRHICGFFHLSTKRSPRRRTHLFLPRFKSCLWYGSYSPLRAPKSFAFGQKPCRSQSHLAVGAADLTLLLLAMFCLRLEYKATLIVSISERNIDNLTDSAVRFYPSKRGSCSYANTSISNTKCAISGMTRDSKINQTLSNQTRNYLNDVISYLTEPKNFVCTTVT